MDLQQQRAIIISASSDIGAAMSQRWISDGWEVFGTYRTRSQHVEQLTDKGAQLIFCDLNNKHAVQEACCELLSVCGQWDVLVLCPGTQEPIGPFLECDFDAWETSVKINFSSQLRIVHELLPVRNQEHPLGACVLFFAGGGTNNATINYSAYTISKIALIKMTELLDTEIPDARFAIIGPGWVKTKIHDATIKAGSQAGDNYAKTQYKLSSNECTPMNDVLDCCDWIVGASADIVSGRNFSVVFDMWGSESLSQKLLNDVNMYKLRRYANDILVKKQL